MMTGVGVVGLRRWMVAALVLLGVELMWACPGWALGLLLPQDESLPPLAVKTHRARIEVTDQASVTRIEQVFVNHTDRPLEATFYFPVPRGATVSGVTLWINGKPTAGSVLERGKARATYEQVLRRVQDPALVEYMDGALFQARIFPVPARGEQKIEVSYASVLERVGGMDRLVYPLRTGRSAAVLLEDLTLDIQIKGSYPIGAIYSPTHRVDVHRPSDKSARVGVEELRGNLEEDFLLYLDSRKQDVGMSVLSYDKDGPGGEDGYFLMVLSPKAEVDDATRPPNAVTFVVDTSGSMAGEKIVQAREALKRCLSQLGPKDRFNIVSFATSTRKLYAQPQPADEAHLAEGRRFVEALEAGGGTAINDALGEALGSGPEQGVGHYVVFMTDGRPTVGAVQQEEILAQTQTRNARGARIFTVGIGYDLNPVLLDSLAARNGGDSEFLRPEEDLEVRVAGLFQKISAPVMTGLKLAWGERPAYDVYPRALPDLFRGGQLVLFGRASALSPKVQLQGTLDGKPTTFEYSVPSVGSDPNAAHDFIPQLWATRKVGFLLDEIRSKGELPELKDEVIRLATTFGLVTPYTSYLALDDAELERAPGEPFLRSEQYNLADPKFPQTMQPRPDSGAMKRQQKDNALKQRDNFDGRAGKGSVDFSIANEQQRNAESKEDAATNKTKWVGGRLLVYENGAWIEPKSKGKKQRKVKYLSPEYMDLAKEHPELAKPMSAGSKVTIDFADEALSVE
jgi:Ca-activated chloride channel family protein